MLQVSTNTPASDLSFQPVAFTKQTQPKSAPLVRRSLLTAEIQSTEDTDAQTTPAPQQPTTQTQPPPTPTQQTPTTAPASAPTQSKAQQNGSESSDTDTPDSVTYDDEEQNIIRARYYQALNLKSHPIAMSVKSRPSSGAPHAAMSAPVSIPFARIPKSLSGQQNDPNATPLPSATPAGETPASGDLNRVQNRENLWWGTSASVSASVDTQSLIAAGLKKPFVPPHELIQRNQRPMDQLPERKDRFLL